MILTFVLATTLHFAGDSTLHSRKYLESYDYPYTETVLGSWCDELIPLLKPGNAINNLAYSGCSTKSFIDQGRWTRLINAVKPGDYVYIQFGHNDQKAYSASAYAPAEGLFTTNLVRFTSGIRAKGGNPIFGTPMVRRFFTADGKVDDKLENYPQVVRRLGAKLGVPVVDFNALSRRLVEAADRRESLTWYRGIVNRTDMTHPTRYGAKIFACAFYHEIKGGDYAFAELFRDNAVPPMKVVTPGRVRNLPDFLYTVTPEVYTNAFANPLKGFRHDYVTRHGPHGDYVLDNVRNPYVRLIRHYIKWCDIENDESDGIEKIRAFCDDNWRGMAAQNLKVIPRVYLDWLRAPGDEYWPADLQTGDYSSEKFKARLTRLIARLGTCWDNDPRVAWIQMGIIGAWGEHHSPEPTPEMQRLLGNAFKAAFRNKKVLVRYALHFREFRFGYFDDSWGWDFLRNLAPMKQMANDIKIGHRYVDQVIEGEFARGPSYKGRGVYPGFTDEEILGKPDHVKWTVNTIRDWHASALGCISGYPPTETYKASAAKFQKAFGYDYRLTEVGWSPDVATGGDLRVCFKVRNVGSAPFYYRWPVTVALLDPTTHQVAWEGEFKTDLRTWLPGENWNERTGYYDQYPQLNTVDGAFTLPGELKPGRYLLALAVLDPAGRKPSLRFSSANYLKGGRHPFGYVFVGMSGKSPCLEKEFRDDLATDFTLGYTP